MQHSSSQFVSLLLLALFCFLPARRIWFIDIGWTWFERETKVRTHLSFLYYLLFPFPKSFLPPFLPSFLLTPPPPSYLNPPFPSLPSHFPLRQLTPVSFVLLTAQSPIINSTHLSVCLPAMLHPSSALSHSPSAHSVALAAPPMSRYLAASDAPSCYSIRDVSTLGVPPPGSCPTASVPRPNGPSHLDSTWCKYFLSLLAMITLSAISIYLIIAYRSPAKPEEMPFP